MERLYSKIVGMPVVVDGHRRPLSAVKDLVMHPENGDVLAFVVNINQNKVVIPMDILRLNTALVANRHNSIIDGEDVIKVARAQEDGRIYMNALVETEAGESLGKIFDMTIDLKAMKLKDLHVAKGFLGLLRFQTRIIPVDQIVEVLEDKVIVKNSMQAVKEKEAAVIQDAAAT